MKPSPNHLRHPLPFRALFMLNSNSESAPPHVYPIATTHYLYFTGQHMQIYHDTIISLIASSTNLREAVIIIVTCPHVMKEGHYLERNK